MSNVSKEKVFQILLVRENQEGSQGIHTTLVTKPKSQFPANVQERLPSSGAIIKDDFLPVITPGSNPSEVNQQNLADRYPVSMLLKARKLSQLIAKSWLPEESIENKLIRKLILTGNLEPDFYVTEIPQSLKDKLHLQPKQNDLSELYFIANNLRSKNNLDNPPPSDQHLDRTHLILPDGLNWQLIRIALLAAGQVYMEDGKGYTPISEPIASTYDVCVYLAFTMVSWSEYSSTKIEFTQPGYNAKPPYFKVDIPYPPILLNESTGLSQEYLQAWAYAADEGGSSPFYPDKNQDGRYVSNLVKNIVPPHPYLPLSCF